MNRAAFFSNPKQAPDGLNSKERRNLKRKPLQDEWKEHQRHTSNQEKKKESQEQKDRNITPPQSRTVVTSIQANNDQETVRCKEREETCIDVDVDHEEYQQFLIEEKRQTLIADIKVLEEKLRRKNKNDQRKKQKGSKVRPEKGRRLLSMVRPEKAN